MSNVRHLLLIDAGAHPMQLLSSRLRRLGYSLLTVKTPEAAHHALLDGRYQIGAAVIPPDMPAADLTGALCSLRATAPFGELSFLAGGLRPNADALERLGAAGVEFGLWEPVDQHTLRFLVNHALSEGQPVVRERHTLRVPAGFAVSVRTASREKDARVYSISSNGAFLATERPSLRSALLHLTLPLPEGAVSATGRVVMTNVPGNLLRKNLPVGMGISFTGLGADAQAAIQIYAESRLRELCL